MKANRLVWLLLFLMLGVAAAQQTNSLLGVTNSSEAFGFFSQAQQINSSPGVTNSDTFSALKAKAENGDTNAQIQIGYYYLIGQGVPLDYAEAVKWIRKAAEQGVDVAQYALANFYANGLGVETNYTEAAKWDQKAAEQNFKEAQLYLGAAYEYGTGVPKDLAEAVKWYQKAAEQGYAVAQYYLGNMYLNGRGVETNYAEAVKWYQKSAEQGYIPAQDYLGNMYFSGQNVQTNYDEAIKWFRSSAEQGNADAQHKLAVIYAFGDGVPKDYAEAFKWLYKEADQGISDAQNLVGCSYLIGMGVSKDNIEAYKWFNLSAAQGNQLSKTQLGELEQQMTMDQIAEAQKLTREYKPGQPIESSFSKETQQEPQISGMGSGFFITDDGFLISNYHVVKDATQVRLFTSAGLIDAKVVQVDVANDLALLKADGRFAPLPILPSRSAHLGDTVATIGFPDPGLQGFSPKLAKGEIASLSGAGDDPRYFQISVPVQPGNSGGALVDERGNVIGIVSAKLDASVALAASGVLPENVNYAVKSSLLLSFLESVPDVSARLKAPNMADEKFSDVVKSAQAAAVLVLVY
jgi:TPR repeat protein